MQEALTSSSLRPTRGPNAQIASSRVSSSAIGAEPMKATKCRNGLSPEVAMSVTAAPAISTTGKRATDSDQPRPGISSSANSRSLTRPLGMAGFIPLMNGSRGQAGR